MKLRRRAFLQLAAVAAVPRFAWAQAYPIRRMKSDIWAAVMAGIGHDQTPHCPEAHFRYGSIASFWPCADRFRSTPESRQVRNRWALRKSANRRH